MNVEIGTDVWYVVNEDGVISVGYGTVVLLSQLLKSWISLEKLAIEETLKSSTLSLMQPCSCCKTFRREG